MQTTLLLFIKEKSYSAKRRTNSVITMVLFVVGQLCYQFYKDEILAYRKDDYQWNVLVADKEQAKRKYKNAVVDDATIDDILLLYVKGDQAK